MKINYSRICRIPRIIFCLLLPFLLSFTNPRSEKLFPDSFSEADYSISEEMVPMRDGVKFYTLIISPNNITEPLPVLLWRTPYNARRMADREASWLEEALGNRFMGNDYIYVFQDIRGRIRSEGSYAMYRPPRGEFNQSETDETTDAWDTVDWLVKNLSTNGRVGIWGTSYPGWLTLAAMRDPHPALAAAVPFNPVVDVWKADDWFHWGAFRGAYAFAFIYEIETRTDTFTSYPFEQNEMYSWLLPQGALGPALGARLDDRHEMWYKLMEYPEYGDYWREVAADQWFDDPPRMVPALHVHGIWDQEDIYGSPAVYAALEKHDRENDLNFFTAGPWYHGQHFADGSRLGDLQFGQNTAYHFREEVLKKFLRHFLHGDDPELPAPVTVFETGSNQWRSFEKWPPVNEEINIYLQKDGTLSLSAPSEEKGYSEYVSDPARPVPYEPRPIWEINYNNPPAIAAWRQWLVEDQRFVDGRPDVVTWVSDPLTEPLTVRGQVLARLFAETTGSDADWVVKLIDVYADVEEEYEMSGYQLMISGEIFRGRYRENYEIPVPIEPDRVLEYEIPLPQVNHTFLPGHRIMVQVQSSWFPLYDRNPQTYVPSIMRAPDSTYKAQRHRIHHSENYPTSVAVYRDPGK
jgi:putative CocE/NonD family hydrolase